MQDGTGDGDPPAFFEPDGEGRHVATAWTSGPWDPRMMHFGPPAALLGTRMAQALPDDGVARRLVRLTFEILAPVPVGPVRVTAEILRPGRRICLVEARMVAGDDERPVALARGWAVRATTIDLPVTTPETAPPDGGPDGVAEATFFRLTGRSGWGDAHYGTAFAMRSTSGDWGARGDRAMWFRARVPLVAGEELDPLGRVLLVADSGNGVSAHLDVREWLFVNPDLSVHLHRLPRGEWVGLDAATILQADGIGQATATLSDTSGVFGRSCQSLLVEPQEPR